MKCARWVGPLPRGPVETMKLTTTESAGSVATARSPNPLCFAEDWKPCQEAEGVQRRMQLVIMRERTDSIRAILSWWLSLPNTLGAWQEAQSCHSS